MDATRRWRGIVAPGILTIGASEFDFHTGPRAATRKRKSTEDDDEGLGLCRLFCEMGEAYLPMIASERDCNQASIVEVLMACTEFPSRKVSQVPFSVLVPPRESHLSKDGGAALQQKLRSVMSSTYVRLARLCVRLSARTENDLDGEDKDADSGGYESHRQDLFEALGDCCCVIGNQAVLEAIAEELRSLLHQNMRPNDGIESCLFALRSVADYVGHSDNNVIEPALQLTCTLPQGWRRARRKAPAHRLLCEVAATASNHDPALRPVSPRRTVSGGPRTHTTKTESRRRRAAGGTHGSVPLCCELAAATSCRSGPNCQ